MAGLKASGKMVSSLLGWLHCGETGMVWGSPAAAVVGPMRAAATMAWDVSWGLRMRLGVESGLQGVKGVEISRSDVFGGFGLEIGLTSLDANLLMVTMFAMTFIKQWG